MRFLMSLVILLVIAGSILLGVAISWLGASTILSNLRRARRAK